MIIRRAALTILLSVGLAVAGCRKSDSNNLPPLSGTLEITEHSVGARVPGRLVKLFFEEGQTVKQGQLLGTLERFEQAQKDYERAQRLFKQGGGTEQSVEQAKLTLDDQQIVSPVDGIVLVKTHETGEVVSAGNSVAVIGDLSRWWVRVYIPEGRINQIKLDQPAGLRFDGIDKTFKGHVSYVSPQAEYTPRNVQTVEERVTQTFAVKVMLDERDPALRPGVAADVTLH